MTDVVWDNYTLPKAPTLRWEETPTGAKAQTSRGLYEIIGQKLYFILGPGQKELIHESKSADALRRQARKHFNNEAI
jgi:hypothetical protein